MTRELVRALEGVLYEWDKFTRYGSPIAKSANERINYAKQVLEKWQKLEPALKQIDEERGP